MSPISTVNNQLQSWQLPINYLLWALLLAIKSPLWVCGSCGKIINYRYWLYWHWWDDSCSCIAGKRLEDLIPLPLIHCITWRCGHCALWWWSAFAASICSSLLTLSHSWWSTQPWYAHPAFQPWDPWHMQQLQTPVFWLGKASFCFSSYMVFFCQ